MNRLRGALLGFDRPAASESAAAAKAEPVVDVQAAGKRFIAKSLRLRFAEGVGFLAVMTVVAGISIRDGGLLYVVIELLLAALVAFYAVDTYYWRKAINAELRRVNVQERGSTYTSDLDNLPNTNYLLAELRKEMPRARLNGVPFVLVHFSLESLHGVRAAHGEDAGAKAIDGLIEMLTRTTRSSDFFAHLGEGRFCSMLNECTTDLAVHYFKRIPKVIHIEVADGPGLDLPITARLYEYDLEALYATDAVGEVQQAPPVPGWEGDALPVVERQAVRPARSAAVDLPESDRPPAHPVASPRHPLAPVAAAPSPGGQPRVGNAVLRARMAPQKAIGHPRSAVPPPVAPIPLDRFLSRQRAQAPAMGLLPSSVIPGPWTSPDAQAPFDAAGTRASAG